MVGVFKLTLGICYIYTTGPVISDENTGFCSRLIIKLILCLLRKVEVLFFNFFYMYYYIVVLRSILMRFILELRMM